MRPRGHPVCVPSAASTFRQLRVTIEFPAPSFIDLTHRQPAVRLAVYEHGPADGIPVVLLHGFPELAYSWRYQLPALAAAGYRAIAIDQRGYGPSSKPSAVTDYDIVQLTEDVCGVLDARGIERAVIVGHDWGALVTWAMAQRRPERMLGLAALSVPYFERGEVEPIGFWESRLGPDFYIVHFNRQPGVADAAFARNPGNLLRNLYRRGHWAAPRPATKGMPMIALVDAPNPPGEPIMSDAELAVFVDAFSRGGFTGPINWYRNFTRNHDLMADVDPQVRLPTLMIYGEFDMVGKNPRMARFVADIEEHTLPCGHWIQQELPAETNHLLLDWLKRRHPVHA